MAEEKKGFFRRLVEGLTKTRNNIVSGMDSIFSGFSAIDDDFYEEIEETLVMGDLGINATTAIIDNLKQKVKEQHIKDPHECKELLINSIKEQMDVGETAYEFENRTSVVLVIGVNGVGKTTSVGKLAGQLKDQGRKVILAAADTFRAAAGEQLTEWANRAGVEIIARTGRLRSGSCCLRRRMRLPKPEMQTFCSCDTAGRLHNKKNLMEELEEDQPDHRPGISGCLPGDSGGSGRNHRAECTGTGKTVCGGGRYHRYHSDQAGRNRQGRHRRGDSV